MDVLAKSKNIAIEFVINDIKNLPENTLGQRIKKLRLQYNLNIKQLSKLCCVSENTIGNIEKSLTSPNITTISKISQVLNSTPMYLLSLDTLLEKNPGQIIYKYRMIKGMSQRALAKLCNLNQATIKDYENNRISKTETLEIIYKNIDYK